MVDIHNTLIPGVSDFIYPSFAGLTHVLIKLCMALKMCSQFITLVALMTDVILVSFISEYHLKIFACALLFKSIHINQLTMSIDIRVVV